MKQRRVFGRHRFVIEGRLYTVCLKKDGVWLREYRKHREWIVPFAQLWRLCHQQTEAFAESELRANDHRKNGHEKLDQSVTSEPLSQLREAGLVHAEQ